MSIYNIFINSANQVGGTNYSNYEYDLITSNLIEDGPYELTFNFSADQTAIHDILYLEIQGLAISNNYYCASNNSAIAIKNTASRVIGVLTPEEKATAGTYHYSVPASYNSPVRVEGKIGTNKIYVYIRDSTGGLVNINTPYFIQLHLKKI